MRVARVTAIDPYLRYYTEQAGGQINVYRGSSGLQRGHGGVGSWLRGLFRSVIPLFQSGAKVVGKQALASGASLLGDLAQDVPLKEALKHRLGEAGDTLKRKAVDKLHNMTGSGIKRGRKKVISRRKPKVAKKRTKRVQKRKVVKRKKTRSLDIFS
jgi:hypothetical protein